MSNDPVLELDGITKVYADDGEQPPVPALRAVSFSICRGELVAIVGPSGSGKSTLLHVMGTLERPSSGALRIGGVDAARLSDRELSVLRAREIGFVFQQFFLAEHATVRENVADGLLYAGVPAAERCRRADEALAQVGLAQRANFKPTKLSGGERQRVAIARALVGRPSIVLADEPTGNLDSTTGASIMELIRELNADGSTIVMITHDAGFADQLPRQIRVLDGQVVSDTRPVSVPRHGAGPQARAVTTLGGGRLRLRDSLRVASTGLRARPLRATLSALGIAIGTAAIVGVLGLSASSQAGLLAEIDRLGTNLLTVEAGQSLGGHAAQLPREAPARITHLDNVQLVTDTALIKDAKVYRNPMIPVGNNGGLEVRATSLNLLPVLSTGVARGSWLNEGTAREPVAVLGSAAAQRLGIDRVYPDQRIWLGKQWFNIAGILEPAPLAPEVDSSALIGYPAAQKYLAYVGMVRGQAEAGPPSSIYLRAATGHEVAVQSLLAQTANPEAPNEVNVSRPSDLLTARAAAAGAFNSLFLGLGVVALIVGAVGVANIMIISVLERRSEIGLRRALGATQGQIRMQFLGESILLALIGGLVGVLAGAAATAVYASAKSWDVVIPIEAWLGGIASAILIGVAAGLMPAVRASRLPPTVALRTA
ncbi:MAG: ATP-binding cassette domain-containing protein [Chloroflexi bacterium]|nr:ATP-binding cassette domain-containing protein [Chloroflexota bacterium]